MKMLTIIVAVSSNYAIGKDNKMLWRLPADLARFRSLTMGHHVIMGRKTFDSIGKPLEGRTNIVVTLNKGYTSADCIVAHSVEQAIEIAMAKDKNPFIIGGEKIYRQSLPFAHKIELTKVMQDFQGDAFFPKLNDEWTIQNKEVHQANEKNRYSYEFITYTKI